MTAAQHAKPDGTARPEWWIPLAVGSGLVVALALAAAVLLGEKVEQRPEPGTPLHSRIGLAARAALVALGSEEEDFEKARAELLAALDSRRADLPRETRATVDENLEIIGVQIAAISEELARDPENQRLARLLAEAYQREIELLQTAAALPGVKGDSEDS